MRGGLGRLGKGAKRRAGHAPAGRRTMSRPLIVRHSDPDFHRQLAAGFIGMQRGLVGELQAGTFDPGLHLLVGEAEAAVVMVFAQGLELVRGEVDDHQVTARF